MHCKCVTWEKISENSKRKGNYKEIGALISKYNNDWRNPFMRASLFSVKRAKSEGYMGDQRFNQMNIIWNSHFRNRLRSCLKTDTFYYGPLTSSCGNVGSKNKSQNQEEYTINVYNIFCSMRPKLELWIVLCILSLPNVNLIMFPDLLIYF